MRSRTRRALIRALHRFFLGEFTADDFARIAGARHPEELDVLLDRLAIQTEDLEGFEVSLSLVADRIEEYLAGTQVPAEFRDWAAFAQRIYSSHANRSREQYCTEIDGAFMIVNAATSHAGREPAIADLLTGDQPLAQSDTATRYDGPRFCDEPSTAEREALELIVNSIRRQRPLPSEWILRHVYRSQETVRLSTVPEHQIRNLSDQWLDFLLMPHSDTAGWFYPLSVITSAAWQLEDPQQVWTHRENDKMPSIQSRFPQLSRDSKPLAPRYLVDPDGLVEVILDVERIGPAEAQFAARLFFARNQVRGGVLNDTRLFPIKEER